MVAFTGLMLIDSRATVAILKSRALAAPHTGGKRDRNGPIDAPMSDYVGQSLGLLRR